MPCLLSDLRDSLSSRLHSNLPSSLLKLFLSLPNNQHRLHNPLPSNPARLQLTNLDSQPLSNQHRLLHNLLPRLPALPNPPSQPSKSQPRPLSRDLPSPLSSRGFG